MDLKNFLHLDICSYNKLPSETTFPGGSVLKNLPANLGDTGSIPGSGRSSGEGYENPLQHSCLGNPMDREAGQVTVHGVRKEVTPDLVTKQQKCSPMLQGGNTL